MYYLLDNNLIINKNDKRIKNLTYSIDKTQIFIYLECDSKTPEAIWNCTEYYYATRHLVVKQSENVFDLIEEGDLVGYGGKRVDQVFRKYGKHLVETFMYMNANNQIKTIYKPNSKGDYIKVWEVVVDDK